MKTHLSVILIVMAISMPFSILAQSNYSEEWGKVTQYEMSMTEYDGDNEAEAVVIYELGHNYFRVDPGQGFVLHMEKRVKIKILKQEGIKYADIEIPYHVEDSRVFEKVEDISAITYNWENGQLTKTELDKKNIYEEKANNDLYIKKFALSDVREGSVVEFKYKIVSPFFFQMRAWDFQKKIPVVHSKLVYNAIPYYEYTYIVKGNITQFDEYKSFAKNDEIRAGRLAYKEMVYEFGMKNLPAFHDEEYITSGKDYMIAIAFQISRLYYPHGGSREYISTWPAMCDDFLKDDNFGKYIKNVEKEAKKILPALNLEGRSQLDQAMEISDYVKKMYTWNGFYAKFTSDKLSDFLKQKAGNVADINLFLIGLLKAAGITTDPIALSTRSNGIIRKSYPFQTFLNYVIAEMTIDGKKYYLDATEPQLYFDELPLRCSNVEGLRIKPKSEEWVFISQKEISHTNKAFDIKPDPARQQMAVKMNYTAAGNSAYQYRTIYKGEAENLGDYLRKNNNITRTDNLEIINYKELDKPFGFSFDSDLALEEVSGKLFVQPFCNLAISGNPFKQNSRTLPIDLVTLISDTYESVIEIPEGYRVEYLPKEMKHDSRVISIYYTAEEANGQVQVKAGYDFKSNLYDAKDYMRLKSTFNEIIKQFSEMVILVKE